MKIKLDENLPVRLAEELTALGHDVDTVPAEGLTGQSDPDIWQAAQRSNRFLVTQDLDFSDLRRFEPGTHAGLLLLRLREPSRSQLLHHLQTLFEMEDVSSWGGCCPSVAFFLTFLGDISSPL